MTDILESIDWSEQEERDQTMEDLEEYRRLRAKYGEGDLKDLMWEIGRYLALREYYRGAP